MSKKEQLTTEQLETKQQKYRWWALIVLSLGLLITIVDASVVNITAPAIQEDYNATSAQIELVISMYTMVFASTLILFGKMGSKYGYRKFEMIGATVFGICSALVALSPTIQFMIVVRGFEGLGAAMIGPAGLALVNHIFKGKDRALAFGIWGASAGVGAALGPVLGGFAVDYLSWQFAFWINVPICIAIVIGAYFFIVEYKSEDSAQIQIDYIGAIISGLALTLVILGLIMGPELGWILPSTDVSFLGLSPVIWMIAIGVILTVVAFPHWVNKKKSAGDQPIFDLALFNIKSFRSGLETALTRQVAQFMVILALSIYMQETMGYSAMTAGLVFIPFAILAFIGGPAGGRITNKTGPKPVAITGIAIIVVGILLLMFTVNPDMEPLPLSLLLSVVGLGVALAGAQLTNIVLSGVPQKSSGEAGAANSAQRQVGNSLATPLVGGLLAYSITGTLAVALIIGVFALLISFKMPNPKTAGESGPAGE